MTRAYKRALASGIPREALDEEQAYWLEARESAAGRSRAALVAAYSRRIKELNAIADPPY